MDEVFNIKASEYYLELVGSVSLTQWVGHERNDQFNQGNTIEVSAEEFNLIRNYPKWFIEV